MQLHEEVELSALGMGKSLHSLNLISVSDSASALINCPQEAMLTMSIEIW
jgi:hypothetical protein